MLATVMALYSAAGPITPLLYWKEDARVFRKKLAVLLSALSIMVVMAVPPVMAAPGGNSPCYHCQGNQLDDSADHDQGGGNDHIKSNQGGGND